MEENKVENELKLCGMMRNNLGKQLEKIKSQASDILIFSLQWTDLEDHLKSAEGKVEKRFRELEFKEAELQRKSFVLEERAKVVEAAEAQVCDLEMKADGFKKQIEEKEVELGFLRKSVEECTVEQMSKASQITELVESLRKTQSELDLKGEQLAQVESDLERHRVEVSAEKEHLEEETERKTKVLSLILDKTVECTKVLETRSSELTKTQGDLKLKGEQLGQMKIDLERLQGELSAAMENVDRSQTRRREVDEETKRKKKDLTVVLDKIVECEKQLELMEKRQDSQQKLLERLSSGLVSKEKELVEMSLDLDLKGDIVISLNNDLKKISQQMESKGEELENVERLIQERGAYCESIKSLIEEHSEELASKEKKQNEMTEAIRKLSLEIVSNEKTLERAQVFVENLSKKQDSEEEKLERCVAEYGSKKKKLRSVNDTIRETEKELKSLQSRLTERKKQVEEREAKMQHLDNSNEKLVRELQVKEEEVFSINKAIMECSGELESKRKHLDQVQSSITDLTAELKSKEIDLNAVKKKIQDSLKDSQSQQARLKASLMEREQKLGQKAKELDAREERIDNKSRQLKSAEQKLAECVKDCELKAKKLASFCQQSNPDQPVDLVRDGDVRDEKTLQLTLHGHLKKYPQIHLDVSRALKASSDPGKLVLDTIQELYSAPQRTATTNLDPNSVRRSSICLLECLMDMSSNPKTEVQGEAIKFATEWKNTTLVDAVNPVEVLGFLHFLAAFSLAYTFDADKVQNLFDLAFLRKYAPSLCEALGVSALAPVNNVLSLDDKPEHQPPEAPGRDSRSPDVQENIASSHLGNEGALRDHEGSASFSPNEVSASLPLFQNSGRYVLDCVEDELKGAQQRGELGLSEPIVKVLVDLLEALTRVVSRSIDPDLHSDATKVAHRWSQMIRTSGISPLEAWGFLQFIVAYGLVKQINKDQTLQFASYVAHIKQAPKLFQSLGLSYAIPDFIDRLITGRHYILAIRFIFSFNLNNNYSPLELLKEEIVNLRRSAKEKTQAEDRDAAKMRSIIELVEDFDLEIELPVDLVRKFMVPRETQNQNQRVVLSSVPVQPPHILPRFHMQASQTVIHSSYMATTHGSNPSHTTNFAASPNPQVLDLDTYQAGGSTASQRRSSYHAGAKRPRVDPQGPRPVMRPCHNPPSGCGRF